MRCRHSEPAIAERAAQGGCWLTRSPAIASIWISVRFSCNSACRRKAGTGLRQKTCAHINRGGWWHGLGSASLRAEAPRKHFQSIVAEQNFTVEDKARHAEYPACISLLRERSQFCTGDRRQGFVQDFRGHLCPDQTCFQCFWIRDVCLVLPQRVKDRIPEDFMGGPFKHRCDAKSGD